MPEDAALLATAVEGIARLNRRYPTEEGVDRFFLLHRRRGWNEAQRSWIGWERKRGKLHELNHLLRGVDGHELRRRRLPARSVRCPRTCAMS